MKQAYMLIGSFLIFIILSPVANALFASSYEMKGTLSNDTEVFFIGKTTISGTCTGYPMDSLIDSSIVQEMDGFPIIGENSIMSLTSVIIAEDIDITTVTSLDDLIERYYDHLTRYSDVNIVTENGLFLLGIEESNCSLSVNLPYGITTFVSLNIIPNISTRFLVTQTNTPFLMHCSGDFAVLATLSETSAVRITDNVGRIHWSGGSSNDYLIIQDTSFSVSQRSALALVPLNNASEETTLMLSMSPADSNDLMIPQLIEKVSTTVESNFKAGTASIFLQTLNQLHTLLRTAPLITNGAIMFLETNDTVTIDQSTQQFSSNGFVRFNSLEISNVESSPGPTLQADCTLAYLGDHFFAPQAKQSQDGIRFPYELVIIWIVALCIFLYIRFIKRPIVNEKKNDWIRRYAFYIHVFVLIIAFLLLDIEIYSVFGNSAIVSLFSQGFTAITGTFLVLELTIWMLGYFILAIPIQLLSYSVLRYFGIGKGGSGIWKAIGNLSIWVFCGFYLLLVINILFSLFDFNTLVPMG